VSGCQPKSGVMDVANIFIMSCSAQIKQSLGNLVLAAQAIRIILAKSPQKNTKKVNVAILIIKPILVFLSPLAIETPKSVF
jgi:hypothetical protein